ncbi:uncharacterized protein MYCFIDRAFT_202776 [Pseudocercospora fijiensis CIRAD86]|uniref:Uncharacterized protein n=1 Tax=Pseudocercospora fijiensis (strain CIRAD86) TaxID=383855 RepID=M2Z1V6_PSEFD|nr:uncharacterized protein MYCFIDRAFT_202776 [Pseudocercospora fijiensis CIRAD86]EME83785.1 hypothetical protein MYCFIDRAFT_202776 [Pseudocercospora fijiensis CIRAD86]
MDRLSWLRGAEWAGGGIQVIGARRMLSSQVVEDAPKAEMNGHANGSIHAHTDTRSSRSRRKAKSTWTAWVIDKGAKALVWYTVGTVLLSCPTKQADLNDTTPHICKPYLQTRDFLTPYAQPYYHQYLQPYVQKTQPYVDQFNEKVYTPGAAAYQKYGAAQVATVQKIGQQQWQKTIKPSLELVQKQAGEQYESTLAPHVKKAQDIVQPYYDGIVTSASDIWQLELEPVYRKSAPVAQKVYAQAQAFVLNTALPQAQYVGNITWTLWTRQVWPKLRILYGENVEPQLLRITQRLGRYKDGKKLEADIKSSESSSKLGVASSSAESITSSIVSTVGEATASSSSAASAAASKDPKPTPEPAVQFQEDLKSWERICAKAVDEGAEDLRERIKDITAHQVSAAEGVGTALVTQLQETTERALNNIKARIRQIVRDLPKDADQARLDAANGQLVISVRAAGSTIKQRAQAVRDWHQTSQAETENLVQKALQSTLETIDSIRELRLTEIGRKYASTSLPHKEWSKYNDIKKSTQTWRNDVEKAARDHAGIAEAQAASDKIEHNAMVIAEDAAKELGRLKEVGKWKIAADDASDDFTTKTIPPPVRKAQEAIIEKVAEASEAVFGTEQGNVESATSVVAEKASEAASSLSEKVIGSSTGSMESAASKASNSATSIASEASKSASDAASSASSVVYGESSVSDTLKEAASSASSAIIGESSLTDTIRAAASSASSVVAGESSLADTVGAAASSASSAVVGESSSTVAGTKPKLSSVLEAQKSAASDASKSASSVASDASSAAASVYSGLPDAEDVAGAAGDAAQKPIQAGKKVWGGANAEVIVEARDPILDDDVVDTGAVFSESIQQIINAAGEKGNQLTEAIQEAISRATATPTQGAVGTVTSLASEQYESALSAASSVMFGSQNVSEQGLTRAAKEQYLSAVTAASYAIYGTPVTAAPFAAASSAYESALSAASEQFEAVKSRVSVQIAGTPKPVHQEMLASAQSAYSAALSAASVTFYSALGTSAPLAAANSAYDSAISAASEQYEAVKSQVSVQVSGTPKPAHEKLLSSAQSAYSDAMSAASAQYTSAFGSQAQNYLAQISALASSRLADGVGAAQEQYKNAKIAVGAEPTPVHQQYLASAQSAYYQALGMAHGRYSEFVEAASSAVMPTPTPTGYQASIDSALSAARSAYSAYTKDAYSRYSVLQSMATSAASERGLAGGPKTVDKNVLDSLEEQIVDSVGEAKSKLSAASASVSSLYHDKVATETQKPLTDQAAENWNILIAKASEQVYGAPPPFTAQAYSRASEGYAQATEVANVAAAAAAAQYDQVQALVSELVYGKEADYTASVYSRLQSAYSTGMPAVASQASSYMSESYESIVSAVSAVFVPPTEVPTILEQVQSQLNAAVDAASAQFYGTEKGYFEQATEAAASVYSDASSAASEAIYGKETNYYEAAQATVVEIGASASSAISRALYGPPPPTTEAAASAAASVYSSMSSVAADRASSASAAVSRAVYGEEQTYLEGVQAQLQSAMASASSRISEFGVDARKAAQEAAKTVSSVVSDATGRVRDEL